MALSSKIDFAVVFSVNHANPNGDPLNGNRPRTTYEGYGEVSDVCLKRKIRDRLMDLYAKDKKAGNDVFVQSDDRKIDSFATLKDRAESVLKGITSPEKYVETACRTWFDVRSFGQVFAFKKGGKKGKKGQEPEAASDTSAEDASADSVSKGIRGPVTVQSAFSVKPVSVTSLQITKSVSNEGDGTKRSSDTMGMKHRVDSGVYCFFGAISPQLASRTGFSDADAEVIKGILPRLFEGDASSARPDGSMRVLEVVWWNHGCLNGKVSSARIQASLKVAEDGKVEVAPVKDGPQPEIIPGF